MPDPCCRYCHGRGVPAYLDAFDRHPVAEPCQGCHERERAARRATEADELKALEKAWEEGTGRAVP